MLLVPHHVSTISLVTSIEVHPVLKGPLHFDNLWSTLPLTMPLWVPLLGEGEVTRIVAPLWTVSYYVAHLTTTVISSIRPLLSSFSPYGNSGISNITTSYITDFHLLLCNLRLSTASPYSSCCPLHVLFLPGQYSGMSYQFIHHHNVYTRQLLQSYKDVI